MKIFGNASRKFYFQTCIYTSSPPSLRFVVKEHEVDPLPPSPKQSLSADEEVSLLFQVGFGEGQLEQLANSPLPLVKEHTSDGT